MATLIHLNGLPGVGKSAVAARLADERPGTLACDIDRLRCLLGGWERDFVGAGELVRPLALAMIGTHLAGGHDVVLPQLLVGEEERERFRAVATDAGHRYLHVLLQAPAQTARDRFAARTGGRLEAVVRDVVQQAGGATVFDDLEARLAHAAADAVVVDATGDLDATCAAVRALVAGPRPGQPSSDPTSRASGSRT